MAACCVGYNSYTEGAATAVLPVRQLFKVLTPTEEPLPLLLQVPFLTFLREVYWRADRAEPTNMLQVEFWMTDPDWWRLLGTIRDTLAEFVAHVPTEPDPIKEFLTYVFDGVVPCIADYVQIMWDPTFALDDAQEATFDDLIGELAKLIMLPDLRFQRRHYRAIEELLQMCLSAEAGDIQIDDALEVCRNLGKDKLDPPASTMYGSIQSGLQALQEECLTRFPATGVDDLGSFTHTLCQKLQEPQWTKVLLTLIEEMKHPTNFPERVKVITLRFFTQLLVHSRTTSAEKLTPLQVQMADPKQLNIIPLLGMLVEGSNDNVAAEAVDFGVALFEAGNRVAQEALLQWLQTAGSRLVESVCAKLRAGVKILQEHKREAAILAQDEETGNSQHRMQKVLQRKLREDGIQQILRLLQLFCEGHHTPMQDFLRQQTGSPHSVNVVSQVLLFLRDILILDIDATSLRIVSQTFDTLTEFCQGPCPGNQAALMDISPNVCHEVNVVLSLEAPSLDPAALLELRIKAVSTLLSLLEGTTRKRQRMLMVRSVAFPALDQTLAGMWKLLEPMMANMEESDDAALLDQAFNVYILLCNLHHHESGPSECGACKVLDKFAGQSQFTKLLGMVEIARDGVVELMYFRRPHAFGMLSQEVRLQVITTVDRESPHRKLADFFEQAARIVFEMEYHAYLQRAMGEAVPHVPEFENEWYRKWCYSSLLKVRAAVVGMPRTPATVWRTFTAITAVVINVIVCILTYYDARAFSQAGWAPHSPLPLTLFAILHLASSLMLMLNLLTCMSLVMYTMPVLTHGQSGEQDSLWRNVVNAVHQHYYDFLLMLLTLVGILWSPLFFSVHLLSLIQKSVLLRSAVAAVTLNGRSLLLTALLAVIIVYLFTIVGWVSFREDFRDSDGGTYCDNLVECFIFSMNNGMRAGGGLGELLAQRQWGQPQYAARVLFDLGYFVVVIICLLNIVFGIIIDTFAQLRDTRHKIWEDTKARCFICGISSSTFDRYLPGGFTDHVRVHHNMWQYLYLMLHLRHKAEDEFTGQESYVANKIRQKDILFFPLNRSLQLEALDLEGEPDTGRPGALAGGDHGTDAAHLRLDDVERRLGAIEAHAKVTSEKLEGLESMELSIQSIEKSLASLLQGGTHSTRTSPRPTSTTTFNRRQSPEGSSPGLIYRPQFSQMVDGNLPMLGRNRARPL